MASRPYRGQHQPSPDGPPLSDLPDDVYSNPQWFTAFRPRWAWELEIGESPADRPDLNGVSRPYLVLVHTLRAARGHPEMPITVYRATTGRGIHPGDWVTPTREYAQNHAESSPRPQRWRVVSRTVPAGELRWPGDELMEWGWFPGRGRARLLRARSRHLAAPHRHRHGRLA